MTATEFTDKQYQKFVDWADKRGIEIYPTEHAAIKDCFRKAFLDESIHAKYHIINRLKKMFEFDRIRENKDFYQRMVIGNNRKVTLEKMIASYGIEEGKRRFEHYRALQAETNTFEYKQKKFGMTREEFDKYNKSRAVTLENLVARHGEKEGRSIWESYKKRQAYAGCKLEYFIEKYGEEDGKQKYKELNLAKTHTVDAIMRSKGVERSEAIKELKRRKRGLTTFYSPISQKLFKALEDEIGDSLGNIYYAEKSTGEFGIYSSRADALEFYDFTIPSIKFCIEFNGDYFHANPKKYLSEDVIKGWRYRTDMKARDVWEHDRLKNKDLIDIGYDVVVIWESDFREHENEVVQQCLRLIKQRIEELRNPF